MQVTNVTKNLKFECELADNLWLHTKGLSFSKPRNMLFKFTAKRRWEFWMFGMSFDIWLAYVDEDGGVFQVVKAEKMTLNPKTWKTYKPSRPCRYIFESPEKIAETGDILKF